MSDADIYLDSQDPNKTKAVLELFKERPMMLRSIYNNMCRRCKQVIANNKDHTFDDYCTRCRAMAVNRFKK